MSTMPLGHREAMQLIHVAKRNLAMDDDSYSSIIRQVGGAASGSAKDLDAEGVERVLAHFRALGWAPTKLGGDKLPSLRRSRCGMASQQQIRMLLALWIDAARTPSEEAFNHFLNNRFGITHYRFLPQTKVSGVKAALESMITQHVKKGETFRT